VTQRGNRREDIFFTDEGRVFWIYPADEALKSGKGIWGPYINRNHFAGYLRALKNAPFVIARRPKADEAIP